MEPGACTVARSWPPCLSPLQARAPRPAGRRTAQAAHTSAAAAAFRYTLPPLSGVPRPCSRAAFFEAAARATARQLFPAPPCITQRAQRSGLSGPCRAPQAAAAARPLGPRLARPQTPPIADSPGLCCWRGPPRSARLCAALPPALESRRHSSAACAYLPPTLVLQPIFPRNVLLPWRLAQPAARAPCRVVPPPLRPCRWLPGLEGGWQRGAAGRSGRLAAARLTAWRAAGRPPSRRPATRTRRRRPRCPRSPSRHHCCRSPAGSAAPPRPHAAGRRCPTCRHRRPQRPAARRRGCSRGRAPRACCAGAPLWRAARLRARPVRCAPLRRRCSPGWQRARPAAARAARVGGGARRRGVSMQDAEQQATVPCLAGPHTCRPQPAAPAAAGSPGPGRRAARTRGEPSTLIARARGLMPPPAGAARRKIWAGRINSPEGSGPPPPPPLLSDPPGPWRRCCGGTGGRPAAGAASGPSCSPTSAAAPPAACAAVAAPKSMTGGPKTDSAGIASPPRPSARRAAVASSRLKSWRMRRLRDVTARSSCATELRSGAGAGGGGGERGRLEARAGGQRRGVVRRGVQCLRCPVGERPCPAHPVLPPSRHGGRGAPPPPLLSSSQAPSSPAPPPSLGSPLALCALGPRTQVPM
jgi:hypothetical protein